jgi:hypothetical protein
MPNNIKNWQYDLGKHKKASTILDCMYEIGHKQESIDCFRKNGGLTALEIKAKEKKEKKESCIIS